MHSVGTPGRTIRLYLVDGTPTGIMVVEIPNWTGKIFVAPRSRLTDLGARDEVRRTGIYCLVGPDPDNATHDCFYIGEADNVLARLAHHDREDAKDFWTRTIIVTSKDENLTKAHARYLESRLIQIARTAARARLVNVTAPPTPVLPETDVADMEYFVAQVGMILPVLGFPYLQPKPVVALAAEAVPGTAFTLERVGARAEAREIDGEFVILKGSTARKQGVESWTSYRGLRDQLVASGKLIEGGDPDFYVFAEDAVLDSPSAAATVILARNANGRQEWREASSGKSYGEWHERQLDQAGIEATGGGSA